MEAVDLLRQWTYHVYRTTHGLELIAATHARLVSMADCHKSVRTMVESITASGDLYPAVSTLQAPDSLDSYGHGSKFDLKGKSVDKGKGRCLD